MKTLYIHIGCPKTATTSIQYFCNENKEILSKNGVYFPIFEQKYKDVNPYRNGHFLIAHQYDSNGKINTLDEHRIFRFNMDHIIYMFSKYNNILLSDESIWHSTHFFKKDLWEILRKESLKSAFKIKIIVYLRRQDAALNSMWNQKIKKSKQRFRSMSWEEFINTTPPAIYLDYEEGLNEIASELGSENIIVRRYGKKYFKNGSIYDDFLSTLGLSLTDDYTITTFERNPRLSGNSNEMQRIFNSIPNATTGNPWSCQTNQCRFNYMIVVYKIISICFIICSLKFHLKTPIQKNWECSLPKKLLPSWKTIVPATVESWKNILTAPKIYLKRISKT